jgi:broad specificity phosphatase PhoE
LTQTGLKQAEAAAQRLRGREIAALYSSPLRRALETADMLSKHLDMPAQVLNGLIDIDFGGWQGLSGEEAGQKDHELYQRWIESPHKVRFPDGESLQDVRQRVVTAVEEMAAKHRDQTVILVSHKVVCQVLLCAMLGLDNSHFWQVGQDVCAINSFEVIDGFSTVSLVNDTCHLKTLDTG